MPKDMQSQYAEQTVKAAKFLHWFWSDDVGKYGRWHCLLEDYNYWEREPFIIKGESYEDLSELEKEFHEAIRDIPDCDMEKILEAFVDGWVPPASWPERDGKWVPYEGLNAIDDLPIEVHTGSGKDTW